MSLNNKSALLTLQRFFFFFALAFIQRQKELILFSCGGYDSLERYVQGYTVYILHSASFFWISFLLCSQVIVRLFWHVSVKLTDATFY